MTQPTPGHELEKTFDLTGLMATQGTVFGDRREGFRTFFERNIKAGETQEELSEMSEMSFRSTLVQHSRMYD